MYKYIRFARAGVFLKKGRKENYSAASSFFSLALGSTLRIITNLLITNTIMKVKNIQINLPSKPLMSGLLIILLICVTNSGPV